MKIKTGIQIICTCLLCAMATPAQADVVPAITAEAAVVMDLDSGEVLYGKNEHQRRPPASLTKVMTGYLAVKQQNLQQSGNVKKNSA